MADRGMAPLLRDQNAVEGGGDIWIETKKLWSIIGPAIFTRVATYLFFLISQSFAGHLGELELNIIIGFTYGLLRSWIVLFLFSIFLLPLFFFATPILKFLGQAEDIAELSGTVAVLAIPLHFAFVFVCPISRFLQCQLKNEFTSYGEVVRSLGPVSPWKLSREYAKLSASSGIMLWILIVMTGTLEDAKTAVDSLSIWVRVANELGAGSGKGARFAMIISMTQSLIIGIIFSVLVVLLRDQIGWIFSSSETITKAVTELSILLAFTILLNSVQPVLSGVAVGSGWQSFVAYVNLGSYYFIALSLGFVMGWIFKSGIKGMWAGMIFGGTAVQTLILIFITMRCDWEKEVQKANARVKKWSVSDEGN
ncbi:hypothetical protein DY000_02019340 [Brassica cretica]|uniref:Protein DETOXIFICATION n=1 Tax=Brassica cretica TaxID=69181 RepID=A0ABQ7CXY2_BRACR|nr:hypothetical protein DY000_02019340 [Brassica cretica]